MIAPLNFHAGTHSPADAPDIDAKQKLPQRESDYARLYIDSAT